MKSALTNNHLAAIQALSHNLKGTGSAYGFPRITLLGSALELATKECNLIEIAEELKTLAGYLEVIKGFEECKDRPVDCPTASPRC